MNISAVIIAKNEAKKIKECIESLRWISEVVVIDSGSEDQTIEIAKKLGAKVFVYKGGDFSDWRNEGAKRAEGEWLLYVDGDERITPELRDEIVKTLENSLADIYAIPRKNVILGKEMLHGGWWPDYVKRLIKKSSLEKWEGSLHEEPRVKGSLLHLKKPMIHLKHDNLSEMVEKSNKWSAVEAKLLFDAGHPPMAWWRFLRIMIGELFYRLILLRGILDGPEGVIYSFYQTWSKFLTYAKLWEMQLKEKK